MMGQALHALGLGTLLYCMMWVRMSGLSDTLVNLSLILAGVSLLLFVFLEKRREWPALELSFRSAGSTIRVVPVAAVIGMLLFMAALAAALVMRGGEQGRSHGTTG